MRTAGNDLTALFTAAGSHIENVVGIAYNVEVMLDDNDGRTARHERLEHTEQRLYIERMQTDCRLIENEYRALLPPAHIARELQTLRLAAREPGRRLTERQISEPEIVQDLKAPLHRFQITAL